MKERFVIVLKVRMQVQVRIRVNFFLSGRVALSSSADSGPPDFGLRKRITCSWGLTTILHVLFVYVYFHLLLLCVSLVFVYIYLFLYVCVLFVVVFIMC